MQNTPCSSSIIPVTPLLTDSSASARQSYPGVPSIKPLKQQMHCPQKEKTRTEAPSLFSTDYTKQPCFDDEAKADELFSCVDELYRHPESLFKTKGSRYITLFHEGKKIPLCTRIVVLPSGRQIYVGNLSNRRIVSDGNIYHLEYRPFNINSLGSSLMMAWAQLSMLVVRPWLHFDTKQNNSNPHVQGDKITPALLPAAPITQENRPLNIFTEWKDMLLRPVTALLSVLTLPGADAQQTSASHRKLEDIFEEWPNDIKELINEEMASVALETGCRPKIEDTGQEKYFTINKSLSYDIDGKKIDLTIPHHDAQREFERLVTVFTIMTYPVDDPLSMLLAFDEYLGDKIQELFDQGNLATSEKINMHHVLLKGKIEKIINDYFERPEASQATRHSVSEYKKKQININSFLKIKIDMSMASISDEKIEDINEMIEYKKGISFEDAKNNLITFYMNAIYEQKENYVNYYKLLLLMEQAKNDFCQELAHFPNASTLEKTLYKNDLHLLEASLQGNDEKIENLITKRLFYIIYDYTRENGISLQSENIIVPGELTKYNVLFEESEIEINEEEILESFSKEIKSYLSLDIKYETSLIKNLKFIELMRTSDDIEFDECPWQIINTKPFIMTKKLYLDIIQTSQDKNTQIFLPKIWHDDFRQQLFLDKRAYVIADIMLVIQIEFNRYIKDFLSLIDFVEPENEEIRITEAKIAAVELSRPIDIVRDDYDGYLVYFKNRLHQGDFNLLTSAAAYWFLSKNISNNIYYKLRSAHFLDIARVFIEQENMVLQEYEAAVDKTFSTVYTLKPSSEFDDRRDYYNQFIDYKIYTLDKEAKFKSLYAIKYSSIGYYDLLFNPKEAYTFKVFSRRYIQNTLAHAPSVLMPAANIGYVSIVKTKTNRLILISTLADQAYISVITDLMSTLFILRLVEQWKTASDQLEDRSQNKFPVTLDEMQLLLFHSDVDNSNQDSSLDLMIIKPEVDDFSNPSSELSFSAVKEISVNQNLRNFIIALNRKTLLEVCNGLKKSLLKPTWVDFMTMHIPLYNLLQRYWLDADMTFKFEDIIFEIFDLSIALIPTGLAIGRLPQSTLSVILKAAKSKHIPKPLLKSFFISELSKLAPQISLYASKKIGSDLMEYFNPLPLSLQATLNFPLACYNSLTNSVNFVNSKRKLKKIFQNNLRQEWSLPINPEALRPISEGIYINKDMYDNPHQFIKDGNDIFQVKRDEANNVWRVSAPNTHDHMNNAIAVTPHGVDIWESSPAGKNSGPSLYSPQTPGMVLQHIVKNIEFEPLSPVQAKQPSEYKNVDHHLRILSFFLAENDDYINGLLSTHSNREIILTSLAERLKAEVPREQIFMGREYSTLQNLMINEFYILSSNFKTDIRYRAVNFWTSEHDYSPINHLLIKYALGENVFIIDLQALRPLSTLNPNSAQVYLENIWLRDYKNSLPSSLTLVKYKDYPNIKDAALFAQGDNAIPSKIISDSHLLREPLWYKSAAIKISQGASPKKSRLFMDIPTIRSASRKVISRSKVIQPFEEIPSEILLNAGLLNKEQTTTLTHQLKKSRTINVSAGVFLDAGTQIPNFDVFVRINPGKLVLFYDQAGFLKHAQISIGNGRFASGGNTFFDSLLSDWPAILTAEELGLFKDGKLKTRAQNTDLTVIAGNVKGIEEVSPTISPLKMRNKILAVSGLDKSPIESVSPLSREDVLLGEHWEMTYIGGLQSHIQIRVHGMPFNVNYMDAFEFSHIVRGLLLGAQEVNNLKQLRHIDLYSCFSGFGGKYSMAQVLANELQVQVRGYPSLISDEIERRHPFWFKTFQPQKTDSTGKSNRYVNGERNVKMQSLMSTHTRLHDFVSYLAELRRRFMLSRHKRSVFAAPPVPDTLIMSRLEIDLARVILGGFSIQSFIEEYSIEEESETVLRRLLAEYQFDEDLSNDIFFQTYFDIIFTVERFKNIGHSWLRFY